MRTTVDLPPLVHDRVKRLAASLGQSVSSTIANLTARGLIDVADPSPLTIDPVSGLPTINTGDVITSTDVAELIDED